MDEEKAAIYAGAGIPEYWMVCPVLEEVRVYRDPTPLGYATRHGVGRKDYLSATSLPPVNCAVSEIFPAG